MLDESMFEDIHEIAENSAYLKAVEEKDVNLDMLRQLPPYEELKELEEKLRSEGKLTFDAIFNSATGFYLMRRFLESEYSVDKAIFIKDVQAYANMRFESARRKVAKLLYLRFVSQEPNPTGEEFKKGSSVFSILATKKMANGDEKSEKKGDLAGGISTNSNNNNSQISTLSATTTLAGAAAAAAGGGEGNRVAAASVVHAPGGDLTSKTAAETKTVISSNPASSGGALTSQSNEPTSMLQIGSANNPIGVYGPSVKRVKERVERGEAPKDLFDEVARDVMTDLKLDVFPRFLNSEFYKKYVRTKHIEQVKITIKDFTTFRVLGRGGFGAVHACRKKNSGTIYAMKCINKKLVKVKSALDNVLEERNVLTLMKSNFVTNLKYALQDEETLYLIMDLMLGGDLKFHLINAGRFTEKRARFYAAEVLLGLEHVHLQNIIYRDMKLENVLLDHSGHCKISDLGLAVVTKTKIKGYAGTPGYTAPEMIKNKLYGASADIFSFGVMLYRMLCGSKPFKGKVDRDLDKAVIEKKPQFPKEIFSKEAISLLTGLLQKKPENRLGCGEKGIQEIKDHPFFESIDWGLLEAGYIDPPFVPNKFDVNAASLKDIGDFDRAKYRHVKLDEKFKARVKNFDFVNIRGLEEEMVSVLEKADENRNFEKFASQPDATKTQTVVSTAPCCVIL